jgi:hypothetical protein
MTSLQTKLIGGLVALGATAAYLDNKLLLSNEYVND